MTTAGEVKLQVPRLKGVAFETAIIERYRRRESRMEEAFMEKYLAGVSVRRVEEITEALWGCKVSSSTISELSKKAYEHIEQWRNRPLQGGKYPYKDHVLHHNEASIRVAVEAIRHLIRQDSK